MLWWGPRGSRWPAQGKEGQGAKPGWALRGRGRSGGEAWGAVGLTSGLSDDLEVKFGRLWCLQTLSGVGSAWQGGWTVQSFYLQERSSCWGWRAEGSEFMFKVGETVAGLLAVRCGLVEKRGDLD